MKEGKRIIPGPISTFNDGEIDSNGDHRNDNHSGTQIKESIILDKEVNKFNDNKELFSLKHNLDSTFRDFGISEGKASFCKIQDVIDGLCDMNVPRILISLRSYRGNADGSWLLNLEVSTKF